MDHVAAIVGYFVVGQLSCIALEYAVRVWDGFWASLNAPVSHREYL